MIKSICINKGKIIRAINSEGECLLDVEKVIGSNPILPTRSQVQPMDGNIKESQLLSFCYSRIWRTCFCLQY